VRRADMLRDQHARIINVFEDALYLMLDYRYGQRRSIEAGIHDDNKESAENLYLCINQDCLALQGVVGWMMEISEEG
jgi:hypothetical protein